MKNEAETYQVIFGSNLIVNCGRVVDLVGKGINKQIIRFKEGEDRKILFDCTITDEHGITLAVVANSRVQHIVPGFQANISDKGIIVKNEATEEIWLEFIVIGPRRFKLNGIFNIPGFRIIATDEGLVDINNNLIMGNVFENCFSAIGLGPGGIGLGYEY